MKLANRRGIASRMIAIGGVVGYFMYVPLLSPILSTFTDIYKWDIRDEKYFWYNIRRYTNKANVYR